MYIFNSIFEDHFVYLLSRRFLHKFLSFYVWLVFVDKGCNKLVLKSGNDGTHTVVPHWKQQALTAYCPKAYSVANNLWLLPYEWHFFYMARPLYFSHLAKNTLEVIISRNSILLFVFSVKYGSSNIQLLMVNIYFFYKIFL